MLEGTELYKSLQQTIFDYAKSKGEYDSRLADLTNMYKDIKDANIEAELTADLVGDYLFQDSEFINRLSTENRNVFQKIYDEIKYLCRVVTAGSKEARELEKVKKAFEDAYRADNKAQGGTKHSISETTDGRFAAVVDNDILSNIDISSWDNTKKAEAKKAANDALKAFSDGFSINGIEYIGNKKSRDEYTRSNYSEALANKNPEAYLDKMRAASVLDDVVRVATDWANDGYLKHDRPDYVDFIRGKTLIKSGDRTYSAVVLAGIKENGQAVFHDVEDIYPDSFELKESELPTAVATNDSPNAILGSSDGVNVAQDGKNVKYSPEEIAPVRSLSNVGEQPRRYGDRATLGKDVELGPLHDEIGPVAENATTVSKTESVAPVVISKNETTTPIEEIGPWREQFDSLPDDIAPVYNVAPEETPATEVTAPLAKKYETIESKRELQPKLAKATPQEQASASVLVDEPKVEKKKPGAWNLFKDNFVDKGTIFETLSLKTGNRELQGRWKSIGRAESSAQWFMESRIIMEDGNVLFCGSDVERALGYDQPHKAIERYCRYGTKHTVPHPQPNAKTIEMLFVPESDLYRLVFSSKLPGAEKFTDWVTSVEEVEKAHLVPLKTWIEMILSLAQVLDSPLLVT